MDFFLAAVPAASQKKGFKFCDQVDLLTIYKILMTGSGTGEKK